MKYNIGNLLIFQTYLVDVPDDIGTLYPNTRSTNTYLDVQIRCCYYFSILSMPGLQ
jgi:hypothetical protein